MTEHDGTHRTNEQRERDEEAHDRQRPRFTDKRRVRPDGEGQEASPQPEVPVTPFRPGTHPEDTELRVVQGSGPGSGADRGPADVGEGPSIPAGEGRAKPAGPVDVAARLEAAERRAAEYLDHLQRLQAEFDNYRKRVLKEQTRVTERASEPLVRKLLEVLDEFDLALMAAEQKPDFDRFLHGVELVYAKLGDILRSEGLERIPAQGKPFDPELHEALMQTGEGDGEAYVADVLRPGYTMRGRVIRPAGVKVVRK